jgi:hypothetical protein
MKNHEIKLQSNHTSVSRTGEWIALILCVLVMAFWTFELIIRNPQAQGKKFTPDFVPFAAAVLSSIGIIRFNISPRWFRFKRALLWTGLLLMLWTANGLPLDLLSLAKLMPQPVNWTGLVTRTFALSAVIALARIALAYRDEHLSANHSNWFGYAAFLLALPYPVLRVWWAFGGTPGLKWPGAAGEGFSPLLFAIPWVLAAVLSLMLVSTKRWKPRRFLLTAGWTATAIVAMIGPTACWFLVSGLIKGDIELPPGMALWIPCLFYCSWFLWAIAAGAATRSYQLRSA